MKRAVKKLESDVVIKVLEYLLGSPYEPSKVSLERVNDSQGDGVIVSVGSRFQERAMNVQDALYLVLDVITEDARQASDKGVQLLNEFGKST